MSRWSFGAGCPRCATALEVAAVGQPTDSGTRTVATARCPSCRSQREWLLVVTLHPFSGVNDLPRPEAVAL